MRSFLLAGVGLLLTTAAHASGSAVFLHPDGMGANTWTAGRLLIAGPDGKLAWDDLPGTAAYKGPMLNSVTASSNGGGTSHAWGVRARSDSFGMIAGVPIARSRSGFAGPLMMEAKARGKAIGIVNTASVTDAGTGTQLAMVANRRDHAAVAAQMLAAQPDVMLGGGEQWFLPTGVQGRHGPGLRTDGRNLIEEARKAGYTVVFTADELAAVPATTTRLLGLFAAENTFNEGSEEDMAAKGLTVYQPQAPRYDVMVAAALKLLDQRGRDFYLMAEEEATDNLGGDNHAAGVLEALAGANRAIEVVQRHRAKRRDLSLVVASDSDCGGLQATGDDIEPGQPVPPKGENGAPQDGVTGTGGLPFMAAPNAQGVRLPFGIAWAAGGDMSGGGMVRAAGPAASQVRGTLDSTDIFQVLHGALFAHRGR
jgi:alkaline phosphatase